MSPEHVPPSPPKPDPLRDLWDGVAAVVRERLETDPHLRRLFRAAAPHLLPDGPYAVELVELRQVAVLAKKCKRTLVRLQKRFPGEFPRPVNPRRRRGQAALYRYEDLRAFLTRRLGVLLPERFPLIF